MGSNKLPLSIKVQSKLIGLDLIVVKPLSAPLGAIPYIDFKYGKTEEELRLERIKERSVKITKIRERMKKGKI